MNDIDKEIECAERRLVELERKKKEVELGRPLKKFRLRLNVDVIFDEDELWDDWENPPTVSDVRHRIDSYGLTAYKAIKEFDMLDYIDEEFEITEVK